MNVATYLSKWLDDGLPEQEAMSKALPSYRRQVGEDGYVGSEMVVALLLALRPPSSFR